MGKAIERAGGLPNQFVGDGIMALFGLESEPRQACLAALRGAVEMATALDQLNSSLRNDLSVPLSIGIGIHAGQVILGEMGYGPARYLTAVGDVVNTASRLEGLNKEFGTQLVVSIDVERRAGVNLSTYAREPIVVRGRSAPLTVYALADARELESPLSLAPAP
jgi:adenylate cyclase